MEIKQWLLWRKNPITGFREEIVYTGSLKNKPKGWHVVCFIGYIGG